MLGQTVTGRIIEILRSVNNESLSLVLLDIFETMSELHPAFGMPVLARQFDEQKVVAILGKVSPIHFCVNTISWLVVTRIYYLIITYSTTATVQNVVLLAKNQSCKNAVIRV